MLAKWLDQHGETLTSNVAADQHESLDFTHGKVRCNPNTLAVFAFDVVHEQTK